MSVENRIRVLIVDDEPLSTAITVTLLSDRGEFDVVGMAADGREAVELALELLPTIVVMDLNMPVMDGIQATAAILAERPGTAVILHTSSDLPGDLARAREAGVAAIVPKGEASEALVRTLLSVVGRN